MAGALYSGSAALLSEALHSLADVVSSFVTKIGIKKAEVPADADHPYGHARIEAIVGLAESSFLVAVSAFTFVHSVQHLFASRPVDHPGLMAILLTVCAAVSLLASGFVAEAAQSTHSVALKANSLHLRSDFVASSAVLLAILGIWLLGWRWLDGLLGVLVSGWLIVVAVRNGIEAIQQLIDHSLPVQVINRLNEIVLQAPEVISHHRLRSRLSGTTKIVDMHIVLPATFTLVEAHTVADRIEGQIKAEFSPAIVIIHMDPYDEWKAQGIKKSVEPDVPNNS